MQLFCSMRKKCFWCLKSFFDEWKNFISCYQPTKKEKNNILFIYFGYRLKKIIYSYGKFKLIKELYIFNQLCNKKGKLHLYFLFEIGFFRIPCFETFTFTKIHFLPPFWGKSLLLELYPRDSNTEQYWWDRLKLKKIEVGRNALNNAGRRSITKKLLGSSMKWKINFSFFFSTLRFNDFPVLANLN